MAATDKKLVRSKSGLKIVALADERTSPFVIAEPQWVPDNQCKDCMKCKTKFDFIKRRHHCRRCGACFCSGCCEKLVPLPRMCFVDPVRQCDQCINITKRENDFFDKHLKVLVTGAQFYVSGSVFDTELRSVYHIKLSQDHRCLVVEGEENTTSIDPVELLNLEAIRILTGGTDLQGNLVATGMSVTFTDSHGEAQDVTLEAMESSLRRQSMMWLAAMQKAMKLLREKKGMASSPTGSGNITFASTP